MSAAAFFITVATSAALFAFQQAGYVQDCSFNLFQEVNVNHDSVILPRISLFKYLISDVFFDTKSSMLSRCQMHNSVFFIEYINGHPVFDEDTCSTMAPALLHLAGMGGDDTFHDDLLARNEAAEVEAFTTAGSSTGLRFREAAADKQFRMRIQDTLKKISRCVAINTYTRTLSLISGHGLTVNGNTPRDDMVPWYIGTDETYGHLVLGSHYIPYYPINNTMRKDGLGEKEGGDRVEFPFFLEALHFPAGSVVTLDAAMFAPMDRLADFFNSHSAEDVNSGSFDNRGSNIDSFMHSSNGKHQTGQGHKDRQDKNTSTYRPSASVASITKEPRTWVLTNDAHGAPVDEGVHARVNPARDKSADADTKKWGPLYSSAGGGLRDQHWIEMCSSLANALQPMLLMRSARDGSTMESHFYPNRTYDVAYFTRPFVFTSGGSLNQDSTAGQISYWLDTCALRPPHANLLGNQRGSQTYWWESKMRRAKRRRSRTNALHRQNKPNEEHGPMRAPHQHLSPYVSRAPCDVNYVRNLRDKGMVREGSASTESLEQRVGKLLCAEDFVSSPDLVQSVDIGVGRVDKNPTGATADLAQRLPSDWTVYASGRGLADMWYSDPALGRHLSIAENPYAHYAEYYLHKEWQLFEQRYESGKEHSFKSKGRSGDGMDSPFNSTAANEAEIPQADADIAKHSIPSPLSLEPDISVGDVSSRAFSQATGSSLLQTRRDEYTELLRVLRAFGNVHMQASDEYTLQRLKDKVRYQSQTHPIPSTQQPQSPVENIFYRGCPANSPEESAARAHTLAIEKQQKSDPAKSMAYSTRLYVRSLFKDLVDVAVGKARTPLPALLYNSISRAADRKLYEESDRIHKQRANAYFQQTQVGRKNLNKYPGAVCDLHSALLTDVPLRSVQGADMSNTEYTSNEDKGGWVIPKVRKTHNMYSQEASLPVEPENILPVTVSKESLRRAASVFQNEQHMLRSMRVTRSVEEYFSNSFRTILSVPATEPRWYFADIVQNRLGELLAPLAASPVLASSKKIREYSLLRTNATHGSHDKERFGPSHYQKCGFVQYIDERDYTILALSLHAAVRKYLLPLSNEDTYDDAAGENTFICKFLSEKETTDKQRAPNANGHSSFLESLKKNAATMTTQSYLCGSDGVAAADMIMEMLDLYHDALATTTQRALDVHQKAEGYAHDKGGDLDQDSLKKKLLDTSTHRPAIETLGTALSELRKLAMISSSPSTSPAKQSKTSLSADSDSVEEAAAANALNLQAKNGDVQVLLYVLPKHFSLAQELVEKWRKKCACDVCFVYIHYHITMLAGDGTHVHGVHHRYEEENDLQLKHYSSLHTGKEYPSPYSIPGEATSIVLEYGDEDGKEEEEGMDSTGFGISVDAADFGDQNKSSDQSAASNTASKSKPRIKSFENEFDSEGGVLNDIPSLRMAMLATADTLSRLSIRSDVVLICVGIEACLGMTVHGTAKSIGVPAVAYGGNAKYMLSAPIMMSKSVNSGGKNTLCPYSLGGTAYAVRTLLSRISAYDTNYRYGSNNDVAKALVSFARRNSFTNLHGSGHTSNNTAGDYHKNDLFWVASDTKELFFSKSRGKRLWNTIRHSDAVYTAKDIHMRANIVNRQNQNNARDDVIDVLDSSSDVMMGNENVLINVTYCSDMTYFAKRGFDFKYMDPHKMLPSELQKHAAGPGRLWNVGDFYLNKPLEPSDWAGVTADRLSCHIAKSRLLLTTAIDDYAEAAAAAAVPQAPDNLNNVPGNTNPSVFPWTARGSARGYLSTLEETKNTNNLDLPLGLHQGGVYNRDRDVIPREPGNFTGPMRLPLAESAKFVKILTDLDTYKSKGEMYGYTHVLFQLHRALLLSYEGLFGDYDLHDAVFLKMFQMNQLTSYYNQFTPLNSYKNALSVLHDVMYHYSMMDSMGRSAFDPIDEELNADGGPTFHADTDWEPFPGNSVIGFSMRGAAFATRTASRVSEICDSGLYPLLCRALLPGQGRGPLPMTAVGTLEFDTANAAVEWDMDRESHSMFIDNDESCEVQAHMQSIKESNNRINRAGREVFGNLVSVGSFSLMASLYATAGPLSAMISSYSKSIAHTDYFSVANRRKLWLQQRSTLRLQQHEYESNPHVAGGHRIRVYNSAAGQPVVHWITMASKPSDRLHNLQYTAQLAGIDLKVVGQEKEDHASTKEFNYSDKVKAFHEYLELNSRNSLHNQHLSTTDRNLLPIADNDLVVMVDAYDVLLLPHARALGRRFQQSAQHPIIFCVEHGIYPEYSSAFVGQRGDAYDNSYSISDSEGKVEGKGDGNPHTNTGYDPALGAKFLNSGCIIGRAGQLRAMVHAAHVNGNAFRNDQQFYVRYQLTYPDVVGLDLSQNLFFTGHKQLTCQTTMLLGNDLSLSHVLHANSRAMDYTGKDEETLSTVSGIGVFHANNLASNRLYETLSLQISRAVQTHLTGPEHGWLLSIIRAIVDEDWNHSAFLLLSSDVQRNTTSYGGQNMLGDIIVTKHAANLEPAFIRLLQSEHIASVNNRAPYTDVQAAEVAKSIITNAVNAVRVRSVESLQAAEEAKKLRNGKGTRTGTEYEFDSGIQGALFVNAQWNQELVQRRFADNCVGPLWIA